jgi:transglutaminase-like putative cysteine protease
VDYQSLAGSLSLKNVDRFNWTQRYGPLVWPRQSRVVFDVKAAHADYWKAENLDVFDGTGWAAQATNFSGPTPGVSPASRAKWTQSLQVTIQAMKTTYVIAAGSAATPAHVPEGVAPGISAGTWIAGALLGPGASYTVSTYSPRPTAEQLTAVRNYFKAGALPGELSLELPRTPTTIGNPPEVTFLPFHSPQVAATLTPPRVSPTKLIAASPYARAFALARRLAASATTPYAFVQSVMQYLSRGFSYDEHPPPSRYPLESFLFSSRHGYCQHFAGAMALLLRMGGIPARVAVGFTPGTFDKATGAWQVTDFDAHAWVEAWFPQYGWVRFDPTPAVAPARGGKTSTQNTGGLADRAHANPNKTHDITGRAGSPVTIRHPGGQTSNTLEIVLVLLVLAGALGLLLVWRAGERTDEQLLAELERALRRSGRPVSGGVTLAELERRFRGSSAAAAYVRAIRRQRFAGSGPPPAPSDRRAVRRQLASGLGPLGRLRALWALPPRPSPRTRNRPGRDVQSR